VRRVVRLLVRIRAASCVVVRRRACVVVVVVVVVAVVVGRCGATWLSAMTSSVDR